MSFWSKVKKVAKAHVKASLLPFRAVKAVTKASARYSPHAVVVRRLRSAAKRAPTTPIQRAGRWGGSAPAASWAGGGGAGGGGGGGGDDVDALSPETEAPDDGGAYDAGDDGGGDAGDAPADDGGSDMGGLGRMGIQTLRMKKPVWTRQSAAAARPTPQQIQGWKAVNAYIKNPGTGSVATAFTNVGASAVARKGGLWGAADADDDGLGAIDYEAYMDGGGQLAGWTDSLLNVAKGAASGALSTGANLLTQQQGQRALVAPPPPPGMSMPVKIAIGAAVAIPLLLILTKKRAPGPVAA